MKTSNHHIATHVRQLVSATFVAAIGCAACLVAVGSPAHAADAYIAVSVGYINENPPVTMAGGSAIGPDKDQARIASLSNCQSNGGSQCVTVAIAQNACAAAASNDYGEEKGATNASLQAAESSAKGMLENQQGARIVVSGCSNGQSPPPNQPPPNQPPPAPKLGPTVSWSPTVGGTVAHITDRSGVSSQCTYVTDNYNRSFALPANSSYDLRIVPAVPQFRNWNVTITCDNGTSTQATTYF